MGLWTDTADRGIERNVKKYADGRFEAYGHVAITDLVFANQIGTSGVYYAQYQNLNIGITRRDLAMRWQMAAGAIIITLLELIAGIIVNIILGWNVWDYSNLPGNLLGQICPQFTVLWFLLSAVAVYLDDWIRWLLWGVERPKYKF